LNVHIAPHSDMLASNIAKPPIKPPGSDGPNAGTLPLQNVSTTIATFIVVPVNTIELGTILQVMSGEELVHPNCTVPVVPGTAVSANPNTALPPGVVFTVEGLPGATPIVTGEFVPVPVRGTVCAVPAAPPELSVKISVADSVPVAAGANDMLATHEPLGAIERPAVQVVPEAIVKSPGSAPLSANGVAPSTRFAPPVLVTVTA
jgi:hypothetical protein